MTPDPGITLLTVPPTLDEQRRVEAWERAGRPGPHPLGRQARFARGEPTEGSLHKTRPLHEPPPGATRRGPR